MSFIEEDRKTEIANAIRETESRTSGELVTVVAVRSDAYYYIPTLWVAVAALFLPNLGHLLGLYANADLLVISQLGLFIVLALAFRWQPLKMRLIPAGVKRERAARLAREQFFAQNLHHTADRTGVLIFVAAAERYVEILADKGIDEKVDQSVWQSAVDAFTIEVKAGRIAEGFLKAISHCAAVLSEHFPAQPGDKNELPNHFIEI